MDDKTDSGKPAQVPYKWANTYIQAMHTGHGLSGQQHAEANSNAIKPLNRRKNDCKAQDEDEKRKAEDFVNEHVVCGVFVPPGRSRFPVYDGGRKYYGRDDSLYRARKSWAEQGHNLGSDKRLPEKQGNLEIPVDVNKVRAIVNQEEARIDQRSQNKKDA
jgi:hypothetical protein